MAAFRFSRRAEADLLGIATHTLRTWGEDQTIRYIDGLEECCQMLAGTPRLGRACDDIRPGLRRMEHGSHIVFYREIGEATLISRILHQRVLPERHAIDDDDGPYLNCTWPGAGRRRVLARYNTVICVVFSSPDCVWRS